MEKKPPVIHNEDGTSTTNSGSLAQEKIVLSCKILKGINK